MELNLGRTGPRSDVPLVLLHAFPLDSRMWDGVLAELADLDVVTLDAPGFGSSPSPREVSESLGRPLVPALETYAEAVVGTLADHGIDRAVVAGLSMGGYAALALAEQHRGLLAGVGLLDTKASADDDAARANREDVAEQALGEAGARAVAPMVATLLSARPEAGVVETVRGWLAEASPAGIAWAQRAMALRPDRSAALEDLDVPTLVLRGAEDRTASQEAAEAMAESLADVELVVVPHAGHLSAVEAPGAVAAALRRLYERSR